MIWLTTYQQSKIRELATAKPAEETCGFALSDGSVVEVDNIANNREQAFEISPHDYARYDENIAGVWHSHLELPAFSQLDQQVIMADTLPWAVYCLADDSFTECSFEGTAPLEGRPFVFGHWDCYSLVSDKLEQIGVHLPQWDRGEWGEWNTPGFRPFDEEWPEVGKPVTDGCYREGDILLMNLGDHSGHTDHVGVFINSKQFLHHLANHLSRIQTFGEYWSRRLNWVIRPMPLWSNSEPSSF